VFIKRSACLSVDQRACGLIKANIACSIVAIAAKKKRIVTSMLLTPNNAFNPKTTPILIWPGIAT